MMFEVVLSAAWIILAPVSWCWPSWARAIESTSPRAPSPRMMTPGYFIVRRLPMLQSIHFTSASSIARPRLVTRLKTLADQFWTVMYWIFASFQGDQLDDRAVQGGGLKLRCGAAFHVGHFGASSAMMRVRSNWPKFSALMRK
jgi:hypothetical protein